MVHEKKVVKAMQHELYPKDDHFLLKNRKTGEIKFLFDVVPCGEEVQPTQTLKVPAPLPQKLNKILASSSPCKFAINRATPTSGTTRHLSLSFHTRKNKVKEPEISTS